VEQQHTDSAGRQGEARALSTRSGSRGLPFLVELPLLLALALGMTLVVKANVAQAFFIPSASMEPQLREGDRVIVSRTAYRLHDVHRGDIVVFPSPRAVPDEDGFVERWGKDALEALALRDPGEGELIKRVVGLPGETISAAGGRVVVDGRVVREPYLPEGVATQDFGPVLIPDGHVFVLGDNRGNSSDSRVIGTVEVDAIVGRAIARIWPPGRTAFL